jgi:hypothetical protein
MSIEMPKYEPDTDENLMKNAKGEFIGGTTDKILDVVLHPVHLFLLPPFFQVIAILLARD